MKYIYFTICILVLFCACTNEPNEASRILQSIESYMKEAPEEALELLDSLDKDQLSNKRDKAKFSLLYSMALDKNYIDICNDSLILPAVKYYDKHGTPEEKFLCHYYQARIYENAGDYENALLCAAKAESTDTAKVSADNRCLLYAMKGSIYHNEWRLLEAIEAYSLAGKYALEAGKYRHYSYYTLSIADVYRYLNDIVTSKEYVVEAEKYRSYFSLAETHIYNSLVLSNMMDSDTEPEQCIRYAENYIQEYPQYEMINWPIIALTYLYAGRPDISYDTLAKHSEFFHSGKKASYYGVLSDVLEKLGHYKDALEAHRTFAKLVKNMDVAIHKSDIKLVEQRFKNDLIQRRQKSIISYIISITFLLFLITMYIFIKWRKEHTQNKKDLFELQQEYEALIALKEQLDTTYQYLKGQIGECSHTDQEVQRILCQRIRSLAAFLKNPIPDSLSKVATQIGDLKNNKNYIIDSIGLLYAVKYPDFVSELREHNLTSSEIGYCCLYLLGLNIPEAGEVIGKVSSIYNINSAIRKKLGISGTNLDKWLVKHFIELHSNFHNDTSE